MRDRLVAVVQLMLYRALQSRHAASGVDISDSSLLCKGLFGPLVVLPPSHILLHFVELYAMRIDPTQPYLGLAGSPRVKINDILQVNMSDVGLLLILILIAQGALLADDRYSLILADGLTELCKLAMNDVLERSTIGDPMVGGIGLQLLSICAWSGREPFASVSDIKNRRHEIKANAERIVCNSEAWSISKRM